MTLTRSRSVVGRAQIQALSRRKLVHACWTPWSALQKKKWGAAGTSNRADACAFTSDPQLSFRRCRFQTSETPEKLAHMSRLFRPCPRDAPEQGGTHLGLLGPCSQQQRWKNPKKNSFFFFVCHCLEAWDWWSGRGHAKFEESFTTRGDGHSAELASATTNSDGKRRTIGHRRRYDV